MKSNLFSSIVQWNRAFFRTSANRRLAVLIVLIVIAFVDILVTPQKRFVFSFYEQKSGSLRVETRFFPSGKTKEEQLQHYVEEYLLGPMLVDKLPLFPQDSRLETIMIRKDRAYINLSDTAALPVGGSASFQERARVLAEMIKKNFVSIKEVTLFIAGNELYSTNTYQKIIKSVDK
ncbi:GerMN domain-containing protein [Gracilinema caldarium]|uniref:GerMN domain-containing protein n=1 Tax=Gracilinema caldarium TaxID=215591 RepID=UPI0026EA6DD4|nr:GerMN domain-containing protein [Gracilinema caldarium]